MGLIGLRGGGMPAFDTTATSTKLAHAFGTIAFDSSGGEYIFSRGCSTIPAMGSLMFITPNTTQSSAGSAVSLVATQVSTAPTQGGPIGIVVSTAQSTSIFCWFQIYGHCVLSADSTMTAASMQLFASSVATGNVAITTANVRIFGLTGLAQGGTSSAQEGFAMYPHIQNA